MHFFRRPHPSSIKTFVMKFTSKILLKARACSFFTLPLFSIFIFQLFAAPLRADNRVTPLISEVTVYRSGAKLSSAATVRVPAGVSEVVFENLSPYFNANSLQVRIKGGVTLNAAVFRMKVSDPAAEPPRAAVLRDSIVLLGDISQQLQSETEVFQAEQNVIEKKINQVGSVGKEPAAQIVLTVAELRELSDFYRKRLLEIREMLLQLRIKQRKLSELAQKLNRTLQELQPNPTNQTGEIALKLDAVSAQSVEIVCTYLVAQAGWTPLYDLRSEGLGKPLRLAYKANVHNASGFDWKNVRLHLSTANPMANNNRPILTPIFADFRPIRVYEDAKPAQEQVYNLSQTKDMARSRAEENANEVFDLVPPDAGGDDLIANFDLAKPQDILADGQDNILTVEERDVPVDYEYHAVPKLDPAVFLLAKLADYGKYNLLPGIANIFYQDTYVGQTTVNPQTVSDTLLLSLGRDEQITIKRVQPGDFTERKKVLSSSIKETFVYEIALKNNKSIPVKVVVLDQIPVTRREEIVVELEERGGAEYNKDFGKLKWETEVPAGQSKRIRFSYSVKYPKDKPFAVVR
jgi:uncharacterized protein (TIGR02231 family)